MQVRSSFTASMVAVWVASTFTAGVGGTFAAISYVHANYPTRLESEKSESQILERLDRMEYRQQEEFKELKYLINNVKK